MKYLILALAIAALPACGARDADEVRNIVRQSLKDPDSAKFSESIATSRKGNNLVGCGSVNSKNSFGGYVGDTRFMVWQGVAAFADEEHATQLHECCLAIAGAIEAGTSTSRADHKQCMYLDVPYNFERR